MFTNTCLAGITGKTIGQNAVQQSNTGRVTAHDR